MRNVSMMIRHVLMGMASGLMLAGAASALTVTEGAGDFSNNWLSPTVVGAGVTDIAGAAARNDFEVFALTGLLPGAQTLTFSFSGAQSYVSGNFSAGGNILYSYTPFQFAWDHDGSRSYAVDYNSWTTGKGSKIKLHETGSLTSTVALTLAANFTGTLYLALAPTYGRSLAYNIALPAAPILPPPPPPAPVPLPAAGGLLAAALVGLGLRRRAKSAA